MTTSREFTQIDQDESQVPHIFKVFRHCSDEEIGWNDVVQKCLAAWRLQAEIFHSVAETGFNDKNLQEILHTLNNIGQELLPSTPPEDSEITRNSYITDITEILSLRMLNFLHDDAVFPFPRVLHKEWEGNQHKGIDLIGYIETAVGHILLIVEVMASVEGNAPAGTVYQHLNQMRDQTLIPIRPMRLIKELKYVHDESEDAHKSVLNGFLLAIVTEKLKNKDHVWAVPVLVRPVSMWDKSEWRPFLNATGDFGGANIPSTVKYYALECDCKFSELMNKVKTTASAHVD